MSFPDLPTSVKRMLADENLRTRHHLWHFVRSRENWNNLSQRIRDDLTHNGWAAPRFEEEPGSGIDFLGMHRQMIEMTNRALATVNDPDWPSVSGWDPIPFADNDADWPVPDWPVTAPPWASPSQWQHYTALADHARSAAQTATMQQLANRFRDPTYLRRVSLDEYGIAMEWTIHGWMHLRWSGAPPENERSSDVSNDWLFFPWSSHVNKTFWKLHGWIDARIADWETATGHTADLSKTWAGPSGVPSTMQHGADIRLLAKLPSPDKHPLTMAIRPHVIEGVLQ